MFLVRFAPLSNFTKCLRYRNLSSFNASPESIRHFEQVFNLPTFQVKSLMLRWPTIQGIDNAQVSSAVQILSEFGIDKESVIEKPKILNFHTYTIKMRCMVLNECGFTNTNLDLLSKYVSLLSKKTYGELKRFNFLRDDVDIWGKLLNAFDAHPSVQRDIVCDKNLNNITLVEIRMDILRKFLQLKYDLSESSFNQIIKTYSFLKHRPFGVICQTMQNIESLLNFPNERIFSHGYLIGADPDNITKLLTEVRDIGGIDIKTVLYKNPLLIKRNYKSILEMKNIFKKEGISDEAQQRCPEIFTLSTKTVQSRIDDFKSNIHLIGYFQNPRILKIIYHGKKTFSRIEHSQGINKRCISLHHLITPTECFKRYTNSFEDKTKGIDLVVYLYKCAPPNYCNKVLIRKQLQKHAFWINIPLKTVVINLDYLSKLYSTDVIYENSHILLYPLDKIKDCINLINSLQADDNSSIMHFKLFGEKKPKFENQLCNSFKVGQLTETQTLSLILYLLEIDFHFTGDGVWPYHHAVKTAPAETE